MSDPIPAAPSALRVALRLALVMLVPCTLFLYFVATGLDPRLAGEVGTVLSALTAAAGAVLAAAAVGSFAGGGTVAASRERAAFAAALVAWPVAIVALTVGPALVGTSLPLVRDICIDSCAGYMFAPGSEDGLRQLLFLLPVSVMTGAVSGVVSGIVAVLVSAFARRRPENRRLAQLSVALAAFAGVAVWGWSAIFGFVPAGLLVLGITSWAFLLHPHDPPRGAPRSQG